MKKTRSQHNSSKTKIALFTGATLVAALAAPARADVAGDALINKLEQKGILSADEAKELRVENQQDFNSSLTNSFGKAFDKITGTPDWVTGYKISGDFRGRYDDIQTTDNNKYDNRNRYRYRLRFGIVANLLDNMEVGFRLGSGDAASSTSTTFSSQGNELSQNSTMQNNWTDKGVYMDAAYAKWTAINSGDWLLAATVGKMDNPFNFTPMVFDPDLTPEGAAIGGNYDINDKNSIAFTGAAFVLDEIASSTRDPFLYGGQITWNAKWTDQLSSSAGIGGFQIVSPQQLTAANVPYINQGNTRGTNGAPTYNFNPIIADASVTYIFDNFALYPGKFPVKLAGEYINNPAAPWASGNGYWAGVTLGKSGKKHTWDLAYRYEYLEANAWYDQIVDDDNGAYYAPSSPTSSSSNYSGGNASAGWFGGTNIKGHLVKLDYSVTDSLTFTATCFINDLINLPTQSATPMNLNSSAIHFMADLMWKF